MGTKSIKIAIVGDVHGQWNRADHSALEGLGVDLVLLVGDFGNEAVDVVRQIAELALPKAVILGNHDAWYTATRWGRKKCPYDPTQEDRVQEQLTLLGDCHVGFSSLDFPELHLSVVGGRPFSWGGPKWQHTEFYQGRFGVDSFESAIDRMVTAAQKTPFETLLFLGHCGPSGLGNRPEDPCGKDWHPIGGDFGDPDLAQAILQTRLHSKTIPLVAFGHMHHQLRHTKIRRHWSKVDEAGTLYINAAVVPRIVPAQGGDLHHFVLVELQSHQVAYLSQVWVNAEGMIVQEEGVAIDCA